MARQIDGVAVHSPTEQVNSRALDIDVVPTLEVLRLLNAEDARVPAAVGRALPQLTLVVDEAVRRIRAGGRVHYFGSGTSGRMAVLDAAELLPTFDLDDGIVVAHLAGGPAALLTAVEDAEDDVAAGTRDAAAVTAADVVIGIAASGRTPYVAGALAAAAEAGAFTALVTANPAAPLAGRVDVAIVVDTGPEAITGSTRLKAGSAQKLVLNGFSTALMVRLGRTYRNQMVNMRATNAKLRGRMVELLVQSTGLPDAACAGVLAALEDLKLALVYLLAGYGLSSVDPPVADARAVARCRAALDAAGGRVRDAVTALSGTTAATT